MEHKWSLRNICTNEIHHINKSLFRLGRSKEYEIVCSSPVVSRDHANFSIEGDNLLLTDLHSCNGTFINRKRIQEVECLQNGDIVSFGYPQHSTPCSKRRCFAYVVKDGTAVNSTTDIIALLEDSTKRETPVTETEPIETSKDTDSISTTKSDLPSTSNVMDVKIEPTDKLVKIKSEEPVVKQTENQVEGSYSIEDNIIVINDGFNEISASQLCPANDPYIKIKKELSEYDYVNEPLPVVVDSDDSDFDILQVLSDSPDAEHSNISTLNETEVLRKNEVGNVNVHAKTTEID